MRGQTNWFVLAVLSLIGIGILGVLFYVGTYNGLVSSSVDVDAKWANVQSAYQRRADLIPNLVSTVKAYANYEGGTLINVTQARASISAARTPAELEAVGGSLDSALSRLMVVVEAYPDLKANENFLALQDELAGTENRINMERNNFNNAVKTYNIKVRSFPSNIIAGMSGFETRDMFEATPGSEVVPTVKFG